MNWLAYTLIGVAATCVLLAVGFFTCMSIQNAREAKVWVPPWVVLIGQGLYPVAALADVAFNFFIAPFFVTHDVPHGWTFSNSVQWHVDHPGARWYDGALLYARFLNFSRAGHIKRLPDSDVDTPL